VKNVLLPRLPEEGESVQLSAETIHHLVHVRRVPEGLELSAIDGRGGRCRIEIRRGANGSWIAVGLETPSVASGTEIGRIPPLSIYIAMLKGRKSDGVVRALTELGVSRIVPITTERTVVRSDETGGGRRARWERIIAEACEQSGRADRPRMEAPLAFDRMLQELEERVAGLTHRTAAAVIFHESAPEEFDDSVKVPIIAAAIGPEGGFAPEEIGSAQSRGWRAAHLSTPVLRAETAAIAATALVQHHRSHYNRSIFGSK